MSQYVIVNGELYHHGVKGMRWGVRRYQNKDGSLTPAGKKRELTEEERKARNKKIAKGVAIGIGATAATAAATVGGVALYKRIKNDPMREIKKTIRETSKARFMMSDKELLANIGRLQKEKELKDLAEDAISSGHSATEKILIAAGTSAATTMATGAMVYGVKAALTRSFSGDDAAKYVTPPPKKK